LDQYFKERLPLKSRRSLFSIAAVSGWLQKLVNTGTELVRRFFQLVLFIEKRSVADLVLIC
jgi:hypothetical protein